ncbi:putative ABC-type nitrate/sulfonate/bicarbonate transport system substrate-binding component [Desulfotignum phosphitoxidans DSM 13687]|uniref:diguanylate cyclase n=2 Tax=Desulfotignum phosphitoxidans TaxID=190898 RepID=S0FZ97_9BACT|nr:putative ABC-type nitrate/sulfonate/bicarbonate transport system substrate-binding component [Desulfotignum phosphitoxidans DSM 13687]
MKSIIVWKIKKYLIFYCALVYKAADSLDRPEKSRANTPSEELMKMAFQRQRLSRRVVNDLQKRSTAGVFFYMLVPPVLFFTDGYILRHLTASLVFLSIFTLICLFRLIHVHISKKAPDTRRHDTWHKAVFVVSILLTALAWGVGSAIFLLYSDERTIHLLMIICTVGFCAGGVISFMPVLYLAVAYNFLMLVPAIAAVFIGRDAPSLGIAMILYSVYLVLISLRGNHEYWNALENEYLLEEKTRELEITSRTDVLTGLYNRRHFDELFEREWGLCSRRKSPLTLLICDIDHFKKVNDTYGHPAGDEYLKLISRLIQQVFQRETDLVARYGGEEFVVLLPDRDAEHTRELAQRLGKKIEAAVLEYNKEKIQTTISQGVTSCIPAPDMDRDVLLTRADNAMYEAKNAGRNKIMVDMQ